ncbi:MAG TPA: MOSC N-terminal beta barrel domain-containing protein [Candidatus Paceibacterota bacterium]
MKKYIQGLYIYPFKSLPGVPVSEAPFTPQGLADDRIFMLVDAGGRMVTLREYPQMASIRVAPVEGGYSVGHMDAGRIIVRRAELDPEMHEQVAVFIHGEPSIMLRVGDRYDEFFSACLRLPVRLVRSSPAFIRARTGSGVRLSLYAQDGYPAAILSDASLQELNRQLGRMHQPPVTVERFRPNIYVEGAELPHEEDALSQVSFSGIPFHRLKLCSRCRAITVHVDTASPRFAQFDPADEPLRTLQRYRMVRKKEHDPSVYFGVNAVPESSGKLKVGMLVEW